MDKIVDSDVVEFREQFKSAVNKVKDERKDMQLCYDFYFGKQWRDEDKESLRKQKRPALTINKVRPLINTLSGYQRLNRYEPDFLPRTASDLDMCKIRKGVTKFVLDENEWDSLESRIAMDMFICGRAWLANEIEWDYDTLEAEITQRRVSPFNMYVDPESVEGNLSDADHLFEAKWVSKDKLITVYPEFKEEILAATERYDADEDNPNEGVDPLWYQKETKKVRLVTKWYKKTTMQSRSTGFDPLTMQEKKVKIPSTDVYYMTVFGEIKLENGKSPYEHKQFPYVQYVAYYTGEQDSPCGVVSDLIDPQREENKRRSQMQHNINTMANSNWMAKKGTFGSASEKNNFTQNANTPGAVLEYSGMESPHRNDPPPLNAALIQLEQMSQDDFKNISNVNEAAMGTDIPAQSSGKAIELKQRAATTGTTILFDAIRYGKKQMLTQLWGKKKKKGLIPQYYNEPRVIRIVGDDGQNEFIPINQPFPALDENGQQMIDPLTGMIQHSIYDVSVGEYDIVVADTPATSTQRQSQFLAFMEMVKLLPPDVAPYFMDILVDLSDNPNKEQIKQRINELKQMFMPGLAGQPQAGQPMTQPAMQSLVQGMTPTM